MRYLLIIFIGFLSVSHAGANYEKVVCDAYELNVDREACLHELGVSEKVEAVKGKKLITHIPEEGRVQAESESEGIPMLVWVFGILITLAIITKPRDKDKSTSKDSVARSQVSEKKQNEKAYYSLQFKYKNSIGEISERVVHVTKGKRGNHFGGFCTLRKTVRSFRFDRIIGDEVIDLKTGEVMHPAVWRYQFQKTAAAKADMDKVLK